MSNDTPQDELLAGGLPADVETVDTTPPLTPQSLDFGAFLDGSRATRRGVRLFPHAHLVARMEWLADAIGRAPEDADVDDLIDQFDQAKADFQDGVWFEVEKRSSEWVEKFRKDTAKAHGLQLGDGDDKPANAEDAMTVMLHQIAAQTVTPDGVTFDGLRRLYDTNEGELNKLLVCMEMANSSLAEKAAVVDVDFSQRRSTNRKARRTSKR